MKLVGMLDSPFVRRTAITMQFLGVDYVERLAGRSLMPEGIEALAEFRACPLGS